MTVETENKNGADTRYAVRLNGFGANKLNVIKAVRELTGIGLKEAKDLVEAASESEPQMIFVREPFEGPHYLDQDKARSYLGRLLLAGASADVYRRNEDGSETQEIGDWLPVVVTHTETVEVRPTAVFVVEQMTEMPSQITYLNYDGDTGQPVLVKEGIDPKWEIVGVRYDQESALALAARQHSGSLAWGGLLTIPSMRIRRFIV